MLLTYLAANYYGMPNYYIQGGVDIQAGNMEDIGMIVEMGSLHLQYVANTIIILLACKYVHWKCGSGLGARLTSSYRYINNAWYHVSTKITHHWKLCSSRWLTVRWRGTRGNSCIASSTWITCMHILILNMTLIIEWCKISLPNIWKPGGMHCGGCTLICDNEWPTGWLGGGRCAI